MHKRRNNLLSEIKATVEWYLLFESIELLDKATTSACRKIRAARIYRQIRRLP